MRSEPNIPLFLWVATAIVAHAVGGGGATEVVQRLEETLDIKSFASEVRRHARSAAGPIEVSLFAEEDEENFSLDEPIAQPSDSNPDIEEQVDESAQINEPESEEDKSEETPEETHAEREKLKAPEDVEDDEPEKEEPKQEAPKKDMPSLELAKKKLLQAPSRSVAIDQHVQDTTQKDNPDARFAGEHANHVDEETRAKITSTDGSSESPPEMGGPSIGVGEEPGNSDKTKIAQADESEGRDDDVPSEAARETAAKDVPVPPRSAAEKPPPQGSKTARAETDAQSGQTAQRARAAIESQEGMHETVATRGGSFLVPQSQEARIAQKARKARKARAGRRAVTARKGGPTLGLGSKKLTPNGVNLNLSYQSAQAIVDPRHIAKLKRDEGERRRSEHRGKWANVGLNKWKPALENYVASVKEGNQTALNAARVPFKLYLNKIHNRLHTIFAHKFLGHLDRLPGDHPLNNLDMSTHLEIALSSQDGRVVRMGITKSSGVTAFDVGALESVEKAAPYGPPPGSIVSPDGNVYLHWEFHRKPMYACSTYFARPYILKGTQKSTPPRVDPPSRPPTEEKKKKREQRRGAIDPPLSTNNQDKSG